MTATTTTTNHDATTTTTRKDSNEELPGPWAKTYAAKTKQEMLQAYAEWSASYDHDSIDTFGYVAPQRAAQVLAEHYEKLYNHNDDTVADSNHHHPKDDFRILDVGAGTGLQGHALATKFGFTNLTALDYSAEMLRVAQQKQCYKEFLCIDLLEDEKKNGPTTTIPLQRAFDAAISVGTFTPNHVGMEALQRVMDWIKPGGMLVLTLRQDFLQSHGFAKDLEALQQQPEQASSSSSSSSQQVSPPRLKLLHATEPELYTPKVSTKIYFQCWVFRVL